MGCDAYATKDGKFKIEVRSYETGQIFGVIEVDGLEEQEKISVEILEGEKR